MNVPIDRDDVRVLAVLGGVLLVAVGAYLLHPASVVVLAGVAMIVAARFR